MEPTRGHYAASTTQTVESERHLVLQLRARRNELGGERERLTQISRMAQSRIAQVGVPEASSASAQMQASLLEIAGDEDDVYFDCEEVAENLQDLQTEEAIIDDEIAHIESQIAERENVSIFEKVKSHVGKLVRRENTTLITAIVTAVVGTGATGGSVLLAISGYELLKMLKRHAADTGADDHLKAIENSLATIEQRHETALRSIDRASHLNEQVLRDLGDVSVQIEALESELKHASDETVSLIEDSISNLRGARGALLQQHQELAIAISSSEKSLAILKDQMDQITALKETKYEFDPEDPEKLVKKITADLDAIGALSQKAYEFQLESTNRMLNALAMQTDLRAMNRVSYDTIAKLKELQVKLYAASASLEGMAEKVKVSAQTEELLSQELKGTKAAINEAQTELQIAKDQVEKEKQAEAQKFDADSMIWGGSAAFATGAVAGASVGGPVGAVVGGFIGFVGIGKHAARTAHRVRQLLRADRIVEKEIRLRRLQAKLSELKAAELEHKTVAVAAEDEDFAEDESTNVIVSAEFGYSQGSFVGAYGAKAAWNAGASLLNWATSKDIVGELKSVRAGTVTCVIKGVHFTYEFDKLSDDVEKYGAVPLPDQQQLSATLNESLDQSQLTAEVILQLLDELSHVSVNGEMIVMVTANSLAFKHLREKCELKLQEPK